MNSKNEISRLELHIAETKAFQLNHPNYCRKCEGWGGRWERYDPSPRGIALPRGYLEDFEPCSECLDQGLCPHCKSPLLEEEDPMRCSNHDCLWCEDDPDGLPPEPTDY